MNKLSKRHLWEWFKRHQHEYLVMHKKPKKEIKYWFDELSAHLRAYFKFLGYSLEYDNKKHTGTLTITVNGKAAYFKKVLDLVSKAPTIPGWTIQALQPVRPIDFLLEQEMEETGIDPKEFFFAFSSDDPSEGFLHIYHPLCTDDNAHEILDLGRKAIYNILGEQTYGTVITGIDVFNLSQADPDDLEPLETLAAHIEERKPVSMTVGIDGKLIYSK